MPRVPQHPNVDATKLRTLEGNDEGASSAPLRQLRRYHSNIFFVGPWDYHITHTARWCRNLLTSASSVQRSGDHYFMGICTGSYFNGYDINNLLAHAN